MYLWIPRHNFKFAHHYEVFRSNRRKSIEVWTCWFYWLTNYHTDHCLHFVASRLIGNISICVITKCFSIFLLHSFRKFDFLFSDFKVMKGTLVVLIINVCFLLLIYWSFVFRIFVFHFRKIITLLFFEFGFGRYGIHIFDCYTLYKYNIV